VGIVNSPKKAYISFLMSVFLMSSIAALAYIGVFDFKHLPAMPVFVKAIAFVAVFSTLFLLIFLLFNLKRNSSRKKKAASVDSAGVTRHQSGLLAAASRLSPPAGIDETSGQNVIYEENGVPYINSDLARKNNQGTLNSNFIKLVESVTGCLLTNEARSRPCLPGHAPQPSPKGEGSPLDRASEDIEGRSPLPPPVPRQQNKPDEAHKGSQG